MVQAVLSGFVLPPALGRVGLGALECKMSLPLQLPAATSMLSAAESQKLPG